jgi:hypothetical protein
MKQQQIKSKILQLTGMSEEELFFFQIDCGITYLRDVVQAGEMGVNAMSESKLFWAWWVNHWEKRDRDIYRQLEFKSNQLVIHTNWVPNAQGDPVCEIEVFHNENDFMNFYRFRHNPNRLDIYPHRQIMHESYFRMANNLIKEAVKEPLKFIS